jgi:hypothetical protein
LLLHAPYDYYCAPRVGADFLSNGGYIHWRIMYFEF